MSSVRSTDLLIRRANPDDAPAVAEVFLAARKAAIPAMPALVHTDDEVRYWLTARLAGPDEIWVAESDGMVVGYARVANDWLDDLYVAPGHTGAGIGTALLGLAKSVRPEGFSLWVFESNQGARRFYERHGLVELLRTDGADNEEKSPDVRLAWPGERPLEFLRRLVDGVDDDLASLLQRRASLTAAIQRYKPVAGHAGRDAERERQIAERMAPVAPRLGAERLQRIIHSIITESLDAGDS